ncbi:MAG: hypothetical protein M0D53_17620 [Flavobacterium sp. JAD_PAG50586_2]|nr:MAG: hypothetical protein M0D53_17620 [Flavobacterium sp. JAD_PAG50586_2]
MKSIKIVIAAMLAFATTGITAQIVKVDNTYGSKSTNVKVRTTTVSAPVWAKAAPANVNYYYLPDINTYYDAPSKVYIYERDGKWVRTSTLPTRYRSYNLASGRTVYLTDYKGNTPYTLYKVHKVKYKGRAWKENGHDNGKHKGHHKGQGKGHNK